MTVVNPRHLLGMNARVQLYTALNPMAAKKYGFSKLRAKSFLKKHGVLVPELYGQIGSPEDLRQFSWHSIPGGFAVKPASGSAGKGIVVIKRKKPRQLVWIDVAGRDWTEDDLNLHVSDILAGQYSTWGSRHMALIEERIPIHPDLESYAQLGTPDIRVIVFHNIPVMAMARIPTETSGGRANLDQGAIGLGLDMGTGKSIYGVSGKKKVITHFPHNNLSVRGIQIPFWTDVLKTAVRVANSTGLIFMGCDIFLHPEKGPMVAEVNAYPGLSIQLANRAGLRRRLERLEGVEARNVAHAVKIAQSLFAESYPGAAGELDRPIIAPKEKIKVYDLEEESHEVLALVNTARGRSVIAENLAQQLGLDKQTTVLSEELEEGDGKSLVVPVRIKISDRILNTSMAISKRLNNKRHRVELGRKELSGFLVGEEL